MDSAFIGNDEKVSYETFLLACVEKVSYDTFCWHALKKYHMILFANGQLKKSNARLFELAVFLCLPSNDCCEIIRKSIYRKQHNKKELLVVVVDFLLVFIFAHSFATPFDISSSMTW